jgi:hypothetical protein
MDGLLESIALRDAAALENAFFDLKGQLSQFCTEPAAKTAPNRCYPKPLSNPFHTHAGTSTLVAVPEGEEGQHIRELRAMMVVRRLIYATENLL